MGTRTGRASNWNLTFIFSQTLSCIYIEIEIDNCLVTHFLVHDFVCVCWYLTLYAFADTWLSGNLTRRRWEIQNLPHLLHGCCPKTLPPWFKTIYCCRNLPHGDRKMKLVKCQNLTCTSSAPDNQRGSWMMCWNVQMSKCLAEHNPPLWCTRPNCLKREGSWCL